MCGLSWLEVKQHENSMFTGIRKYSWRRGSQNIRISPSRFLGDLQLYQLNITALTNHPKTHWFKTRATFMAHDSAGQPLRLEVSGDSFAGPNWALPCIPGQLQVGQETLQVRWLVSHYQGPGWDWASSASRDLFFSSRLVRTCSHRQVHKAEWKCAKSVGSLAWNWYSISHFHHILLAKAIGARQPRFKAGK